MTVKKKKKEKNKEEEEGKGKHSGARAEGGWPRQGPRRNRCNPNELFVLSHTQKQTNANAPIRCHWEMKVLRQKGKTGRERERGKLACRTFLSSKMWADQPAVRAMTKIGVKKSVGMPHWW